MPRENSTNIKIFFSGDVMTGRGVDQILRHPSSPNIYEPYLKDARDYITLAESLNGPIPREAKPDYIWGNALNEWQKQNPLVKVINLETAITTSDKYCRGKDINYRMHPKNIDLLTSAHVDICALSNNHILDWQKEGLNDTLATLNAAGIRHSGAGVNQAQAKAPAILPLPNGERLLMFSMAHTSSGVPENWQATEDRPGVYLLNNLSQDAVEQVKANIDAHKRPGDLIIVSIHWGANWGYEIPESHQNFARALIDQAGVTAIHGHSSHHPIGIEIHNSQPILYGCGDFINDYEGISGYENFKGHLTLMYFAEFEPNTHKLVALELVPMKIKQFQLHYAGPEDQSWMTVKLNQASQPFAIHFESAAPNKIVARIPKS